MCAKLLCPGMKYKYKVKVPGAFVVILRAHLYDLTGGPHSAGSVHDFSTPQHCYLLGVTLDKWLTGSWAQIL